MISRNVSFLGVDREFIVQFCFCFMPIAFSALPYREHWLDDFRKARIVRNIHYPKFAYMDGLNRGVVYNQLPIAYPPKYRYYEPR